MTEFLQNIFATIFGDNVVLATILIAMVPIIELRGAIPFAVNANLWNNALNDWPAFGWSLLGSCLVVPILALIFTPVIKWLKSTKIFSRLALSIENRVKNKAASIESHGIENEKFTKSYWKKMLAIFTFVAIPLPLTGVWTGTCIAVFVGLDFISTCISVTAGNVVAGLLIVTLLKIFPGLDSILIYIFLALVLLFIIYEIVAHFIKKKKSQTAGTNENKEEK